MKTDPYDLQRFLNPQEQDFDIALKEIREGHKRSHWIWYIFPQLKGLGMSSISEYYGISGLEEARAFLKNPVLGGRLKEITEALLSLESDCAEEIFGYPDNLKVKSSMTLFGEVDPENPLFQKVLNKFYAGEKDERTLQMLQGKV